MTTPVPGAAAEAPSPLGGGASSSPKLGPARRPKRWLLTPSERTLLCLLGTGRSMTELAAELDRAVWTLNTHRTHAYRKLGVHSLEEALRRAVELGEMSVWDIVRPVEREASAVARLASLRTVAQRVVRSGSAVEAAVAARFLAVLDGEG